MGNANAATHMENARKTGVLTLPKANLLRIPPQALTVVTLRVLDLSGNRIAALGVEIAAFVNLKQLNLANNRLASLPDCVGSLVKIDTLNLSGNALKVAPPCIATLVALKTLNLSETGLTAFPTEALSSLTKLLFLDLNDNAITELPQEGFGELNVSELCLARNQLGSLPASLATMSRLKVVHCEENCLTAKSIATEVFRDSQIHSLGLEGNPVTSRELRDCDGWDAYESRGTLARKKMV